MILNSGGSCRFLRNSLGVVVLAMVCLAPVSSARAAVDDLGEAAGGACIEVGTAIVVALGDASALPGETASVPIAISNTTGTGATAFQLDFFFPEADLTFDMGTACAVASGVLGHAVQAFLNPPTCIPPDGDACVRLALSANFGAPPLSDGPVVTCDFGVASEVEIGTVLDLIADASSLIVSNGSTQPVCLEPVATEDGTITVQEQPPPTATRTATPVPPTATATTGGGDGTPTPTSTTGIAGTATPTSTPGGTLSTATPTTGIVGTATPTHTPGGVLPTSTPTGGIVGTPTATPATAVPTRTRTAVGPIKTNTPGTNGLDDDSCAITPVAHSNPLRSLVLLVVPAMLLAGRRRRR